ncbi:hypothetical protein THAOC_24597, partial [Thalassiosira oceanica]
RKAIKYRALLQPTTTNDELRTANIMSGQKSSEKQQSPCSSGERTKRRSVKRSSSSVESSGNSCALNRASGLSTRNRQPPVPTYRVINEDSPGLELEIPTGVPLRELGLASSRRWDTTASRRRDESRPCLDFVDFFADGDLAFGRK